jgi:hypothetical protein
MTNFTDTPLPSYLNNSHFVSMILIILWLMSLYRGRLELAVALATGLAPLARDDVTQVRIEASAQLQLLGDTSPEGSIACTPVVTGSLLSRVGDVNGPARLAAQRALYYLLQFQRGPEAANKTTLAVTKKLTDRDEAETLVNFCKKTLSKARFAEEAKEEEAKRAAAPLTASTPGSNHTSLPSLPSLLLLICCILTIASEFKEEKAERDYTHDENDDEEEDEEDDEEDE